MRSVSYKKTAAASADTTSGLSPSIWGDLPLEDWLMCYTGLAFIDEMADWPVYALTGSAIKNQHGYGVFGTNSGSISPSASSTDPYGAIILAPVASSGAEAYMGPAGGTGYMCTTPSSATPPVGQVFACEFRVKPSSITNTNLGWAVGLGDPGLAITTGSLAATTTDIISTANFIGFRCKASVANTLDGIYQAASQTQQVPVAAAATLVAATYIKVGLRFDGVNAPSGLKRIRYFVNGVEQYAAANYITDANIAAATFPSSALLLPLVLAKLGAGATGTLTVDWMAFGQSRAPLA